MTRAIEGNGAPPPAGAHRAESAPAGAHGAESAPAGAAATPLLAADSLTRHYRLSRGVLRAAAVVHALDDVSFTLHEGRTLAVVGESGSGKSTLARLVAMIEAPTAGRLEVAGVDPNRASRAARQRLRPQVQMVFQNPYASLNPRKRVATLLTEPLAIQKTGDARSRRAAALSMLARVGLRAEHAQRYPHMFSGGQRQRIAIARALMPRPRLVVADEPTSALDVSIQAQVLNLLLDLKDELGLAYLFISHNLDVVRHLADEVLVLYLGRVVEHGSREAVFERPRHPYTRALLASTPSLAPRRQAAAAARMSPANDTTAGGARGEPPSPLAPPRGCAFHARCDRAQPRCADERPAPRTLGGVVVACHFADN